MTWISCHTQLLHSGSQNHATSPIPHHRSMTCLRFSIQSVQAATMDRQRPKAVELSHRPRVSASIPVETAAAHSRIASLPPHHRRLYHQHRRRPSQLLHRCQPTPGALSSTLVRRHPIRRRRLLHHPAIPTCHTKTTTRPCSWSSLGARRSPSPTTTT
jgi:hypothetical protein